MSLRVLNTESYKDLNQPKIFFKMDLFTRESSLFEISLKYKKSDIDFRISCSSDVKQYVSKLFDPDTIDLQEQFIAIYLNNNLNIIGFQRLSTGGLNSVTVDVRLIFATALKCSATSVIIAHNHPSGNMNPSQADKQLTKKVGKGLNLLDIKLLDHVIVSSSDYYSFADNCETLM
jgi:DNA repair protein RadC